MMGRVVVALDMSASRCISMSVMMGEKSVPPPPISLNEVVRSEMGQTGWMLLCLRLYVARCVESLIVKVC